MRALRCLHECVPGIPAGWRSRICFNLSRAMGIILTALLDGMDRAENLVGCHHPVRCVRGRVPGESAFAEPLEEIAGNEGLNWGSHPRRSGAP